jgi:hypothetical protein
LYDLDSTRISCAERDESSAAARSRSKARW